MNKYISTILLLLVSLIQAKGQYEANYTYDDLDRLTQTEYIDGSGNLSTKIYAYDQLGNRQTYTVSAGAMADLVVTTGNANPNIIPVGGAFTLTFSQSNVGGTATTGHTVGVYLSSDGNYNNSDVLVGSITQSGLPSGYTIPRTMNLNIPNGTTPGSYNLLIFVDSNGQINEGDESNNVYAIPITVGNNTNCNLQLNFTTNNPTTGNNDGSIAALISNGLGPYTYAWSDGQTYGSTAAGLVAGTYGLTVTDGTGCSISGQVTLSDQSSGGNSGSSLNTYIKYYELDGSTINPAIQNIAKSKTANEFVGGASIFSSGNTTQYIFKVDEFGDLIWKKKISNVSLNSIVPCTGGYLLTLNSGGNLMKINESGATVWTRQLTPNPSYYTSANHVFEDSNGDIYWMGTEQIVQSTVRPFIIKYTASGGLSWLKRYGANLPNGQGTNYNKMIETSDGNLLLVGSYSPSTQYSQLTYHVLKINTNGGILWSNYYDDSGSINRYFSQANPDYNGDIVLGGNRFKFGSGYQAIITKINQSNGNLSLTKSIDIPSTIGTMQATNDGNFMVLADKSYHLFAPNFTLISKHQFTDLNGFTNWGTQSAGGGFVNMSTYTDNGVKYPSIVYTDELGLTDCDYTNLSTTVDNATFTKNNLPLTIGGIGFTLTNSSLATVNSNITVNPVCTSAGGCNLALTASSTNVVNGNDGSATVMPNGGVSPYTYQWNTGANSNNINNLNAGTYTAIVMDNANCSDTISVTINDNCPTNIFVTYPPQLSPDYQAGNKIETVGTVVVETGQNVVFRANQIRLKPGFRTDPGANFRAYVDPCSPTTSKTDLAENAEDLEEIDPDLLEVESLNISPNPTSTFADIQFNVNKSTIAQLIITDLAGKPIAVLLDGEAIEQGQHSFTFDASPFSKGLYLCILQTPEMRLTQKISIQ